MVDIRRGDDVFQRFVCSDPSRNRDFPLDATPGTMQDETHPLDTDLETVYVPGRRPATMTIVAGPGEEQLGVVLNPRRSDPTYRPLQPGERVALGGGVSFHVPVYEPRSTLVERPLIVPPSRREQDPRFAMSMIRVRMPGTAATPWLQFQDYPFPSTEEALHRYPHRPVSVRLDDGREIELVFSRRSMPLPAPVALEAFELTQHLGGYTGSIPSIRDWTSHVRFADGAAWGPAQAVSVNKPVEHDGFWFFQAQWDPPAEGGRNLRNGLTYTVLGVGNRNGVVVQLVGCCIAVFGMIYAFYIKPVIKRRRQREVYAASQRAERRDPVAAGTESGR
jgi:hypothetical protein